METKTGELLTKNIAGVNRILPHKHKYAWDLFLKSCANNWMPTEISMQNDIKQWKNDEITEDEKLLVKRCLGFFAGSESLVGNNLCLVPLDILLTLSAVSTSYAKRLKKVFITSR